MTPLFVIFWDTQKSPIPWVIIVLPILLCLVYFPLRGAKTIPGIIKLWLSE